MQAAPNPPARIRAILIEDHAEFRDILREALESADRFDIEAGLSNAEDAFDYLETTSPPPDVLILDLGLPQMDGIDAIPLLRKLAPEAKILVLTVFDNKARVFQALGAGADGYLIKSDGLDSIVQGIEEASHGIAPLSADIARMVFDTFSHFKPASPDTQLSDRETEVLQHLFEGMSRQDAATSMNISKHTINTHIRRIYRKLQVHNISGAISKANTLGII